MPPLKAFTTNLSELVDRFDCSCHEPQSRTAIELINNAEYQVTKLTNLSQKIFVAPRFKRIYVTQKYGTPFMQGSHLAQIKCNDLKYISCKNTKNIKQWIIDQGWVLVTCSGTIGRVSIVSSHQKKWAASQHILRIIPNNQSHSGYIAAFLMTPYGQHQLKTKVYGAVIDELTEKDTRNIFIPNAPLDIQTKIGEKVVKAFEYKEEANLIEEKAINLLEQKLEQGFI
jgi:type I restriction enzyme S subunit